MDNDGNLTTGRERTLMAVFDAKFVRRLSIDETAAELNIGTATVERYIALPQYSELADEFIAKLKASCVPVAWRALFEVAATGPPASRIKAAQMLLDRTEGVPRTSSSVEVSHPERPLAHLSDQELLDIITDSPGVADA